MTFDEILVQVLDLLQRERRVSYRALKRRFALDDEYLEDLKAEIIKAKQLAIDEGGEVLVWTGGTAVTSCQLSVVSPQPPAPSTQRLAPRPQTLDSRRSDGERRQLTVLFCDLVGSTALSSQLDPEELREIVREYQVACEEVIHRFDGYIARYVGDALLVYFGYPVAHEDDAQRAVRAGLGIIRALQKWVPSPLVEQASSLYAARMAASPEGRGEGQLQVRIGIHTGLVVVGEMGGSDYREAMALGETPNIAARLQGIAEPDTIVTSAATYRLIAGMFECRDLGAQQLKGVTTPLTVYRVLSESGIQSRFEVAIKTGLTPLVGRDHEVGLLRDRWERTKQGEGQVVLLSGEAGIGKSRLAQELKERVAKEGGTRIEFHCSPYYQNTAFYPVIEHVQRLLQFQRDDDLLVKLQKLEETLASYRFPQADTVPLLAAFLSFPHPEGYPPLTLSPQKQKQKTQEALLAWLLEEAERTPVYCPWEDLHWIDPSSLELLTLLIDQVPTARLLTLLSFRPEFSPPWDARSYLTQLTLSRLERTRAEMMAEQVMGGKALPTELLQQIVAKTDGVPLFVEELTKMVIESMESIGSVGSVGSHKPPPLPAVTIPATLHDSLMARLDRLGPTKEVAQIGATLGREFSYELIQAVSPVEEAKLQQALAKLIEAEVLYQRGVPPQTRYLFKHALIQDTAYQSLLKGKRQQFHRQIAQVLEERFAEVTETQPELVAHHYTEAGLVAQAIPYWQKAGQRAIQHSAHAEAVAHLTKGLELLKTQPNTSERAQQELTLQTALGTTLSVTRGYAAPEVKQAYGRALALCRQVGETPQLFPALFGLWRFHFLRGELQTAHELAEQVFRLAQHLPDPALLVWPHAALGLTLCHLGELPAARTHLEQGISLYDPRKHRPDRSQVSGQDPKVTCLSYVARILWHLGYPSQARKRIDEALSLAQELSHPFSLAFALNFAAALDQLLRDVLAVHERTAAVMTLAREQGFPYWLAWGTIQQGWVLTKQGQGQEGIAQMGQGFTTMRATGAKLNRAYGLSWLATAYGQGGQIEEGLTVLAEGLDLAHNTKDRFYEAELYRLKGELTLQRFQVPGAKFKVDNPHSAVRLPQSEAEACFLKAIDIARQQQAKSLELRATMSLSRLWQQQGKKEEARKLLAEIYGWFTEGFDTKDLQEAGALLDTLM